MPFIQMAMDTHNNERAYITNFDSDFISVIDLKSLEKVADVKTGKNPHGAVGTIAEVPERRQGIARFRCFSRRQVSLPH